ncbi:MAG: tRNA preQ1(34) S-adenosylmethionine ribosyltransferase-isomerase QueA [Steroidobacteraceae bacterium]
MQLSDFLYELPGELIAQAPLAERSASRQLLLDAVSGKCEDRAFRELPQLLDPGDLLVLNDTRVVAARITGAKPSGGRVEMLLERPLPGRHALVQASASKPIRGGVAIGTAGGRVRVIERRDVFYVVELPGDALEFFERYGEVPLPPYIHRPPEAADRERYQAVFARAPGAVAAPTASLHFDQPLLAALDRRAVNRTFVTLHVGAGTFQPVRSVRIEDHRMHAEWLDVSAAACEAIAATRRAGRRVVAVGTTVVRALETASLEGTCRPYRGDTALFIRPGHGFRSVDALVTNFHLPGSTLMMLVSAFAGREQTLAAYAHAVRERYRFFSYGDAMLIAKQARG